VTTEGPPPLAVPPVGAAERARSTSGAATLTGTFWTIGSQIAPFAYTIAVSVVAARILGPDRMGRQSFIAFVVYCAIGIAGGGFAVAVTRYVAEAIGAHRAAELPGLVRWTWRIAIGAGALGSAGLVVVAILGRTPQLAWYLAAVAVFAGTLHKLVGSILLGGRRFRVASMISLRNGAVSSIATIVVLALGGGISGMFAVLAASVVSMLVLAMLQVRRMLVEEQAPAKASLGPLPKAMVTFGLASTLPYVLQLIVAQRSELFFLDRSSSDAQIAFYAVAFSLIAVALAIPAAIQQVLSPTFATLFGAGSFDRIRASYARALRLLLLMSIPLTAGALALGPRLIELVYGHDYRRAGTVLLVLAASLPLLPVSGASQALLIGYRRMRFPIVVGVVAAAIDLTAAALLVPRFDAIGAAIANVSASVAAAAIALIYCARLVGGVELRLASLWRMVAVSVAAGLAAWGVLRLVHGAPGFVVALAVAVAVFGALGTLVGVLPREDAEWLARASAKGRGRFIGPLCLRLSHAPRRR
jgi:O-antigen/teichoic acid export membrane protein